MQAVCTKYLAALIILAQSSISVAQERKRLDAQAVIVLPKESTYEWTKGGKSNPVCAPTSFQKLTEDHFPKLLEPIFQSISVARSETVPERAGSVVFKIVINSASGKFRGVFTDGKFEMSLDVVAEMSGEQLRKKSYLIGEEFAWGLAGDCSGWLRGLEPAVTRGFVGVLERFTKEFLGDQQAVAAFEAALLEQRETLASVARDLKPLLATYRVADAEAVIRRQPATASTVVRRIGQGAVLQVIGQLPTGWLQVAREGEPLGWVHSGSVSIVSSTQVASGTAPAPSSPVPAAPAESASSSTAIDLAFWDSVKNSTIPGDFQAYLQRFPHGIFASLARSRLGSLGEPAPAQVASIPLPAGKFDFGNYHALVIGNDNYRSLTPLKTAAADARAVAGILEGYYGFKVTLLIDATRNQLLDAFDQLRSSLTERDNLLIYYAGHGYLDTDSDRGFWLPIDADGNRRANWLSNSDLADTVRATRAKHVLVVADSCYAGTLTRNIGVQMSGLNDLSRLAQKRARTALTSGGLEPVEDSGGGNHSVFAKAFLETLGSLTGVVDMSQVFSALRRRVVTGSQQTPQYGDIRQTGHEGGDFLFVRRK